MRPDKTGYWWFELLLDGGTIESVAYITFEESINCPDFFEKLPTFRRWLGQAHPPKDVQRYDVELGDWVEYICCDCGDFVMYDDVKEFIRKV